MLIAKIKRCPYPHARIVRIDTGAASAMSGVRAVVTGKDFPILPNVSTPALAVDEVLYSNQSVVAVAAENAATAIDACERIVVEYAELPSVNDAEVAMSASSPTIIRPGPFGPNVGMYWRARKGDTGRALMKADHIIENTYSSAIETHFQMEPLTFIARPDPDGGVTIWGTVGGAHSACYELAEYLGLEESMVRVNVGFLGGWFGSKEESHVGAICAKLALVASRPVKLELSREETITATAVRHPAKIRVRDGVNSDGRIIAREVFAVYDGGAYGVVGNEILKNSILAACSVYNIPNFTMDTYRVFTNRVPGAAKAATTGPQMIIAIESQMDHIASALNLNPVEVRLWNFLHEGDENAIGERMESISYDKCVFEIAKRISPTDGEPSSRASRDGKWRFGTGFAVASKWVPGGTSYASLRVYGTGQVELWLDAVENGQGIFTGIMQIIATSFGITSQDIVIVPFLRGADSSESLPSVGASGSRQLVYCGNATLRACQDAKRKIIAAAAPLLGVSEDDLDMRGRRVFSRMKSNISVGLGEVFDHVERKKVQSVDGKEQEAVLGEGYFATKTGQLDRDKGRCVGGRISPYYVSVAQAVQVRVDIETGRLKVIKIVAAMDVGRAINPEIVKAQMRGSIAMGVSAAIGEELVITDGRIANPNLADYKLMNIVDAPEIEPVIIETPLAEGPFGAKGAGNPSIIPTCAAISNAVHNATGVFINELPITPEKILEGLRRRD